MLMFFVRADFEKELEEALDDCIYESTETIPSRELLREMLSFSHLVVDFSHARPQWYAYPGYYACSTMENSPVTNLINVLKKDLESCFQRLPPSRHT